MRIFGALLVMAASTAAGWIYGALLKKRWQLLNALIQGFQWLGTEIGYGSVPLGEAFTRIGARLPKEVQALFTGFAAALNGAAGLTADEAWQESLTQNRDGLALTAEDWAVLSDFGRTLGTTDREHQVSAIRQTIARLTHQATEAEGEYRKNERLYRYLGMAAGALVVLVFY
ncbi:MAG: stage III sporulation protein AB [Firmicutes bacterium]|nr:stage III sporulation protein AB [Bacillota bacterium]